MNRSNEMIIDIIIDGCKSIFGVSYDCGTSVEEDYIFVGDYITLKRTCPELPSVDGETFPAIYTVFDSYFGDGKDEVAVCRGEISDCISSVLQRLFLHRLWTWEKNRKYYLCKFLEE